ncbi:unnamed protein product [Protopolystoma xenopodis]|uniref:Uncharacterized protein n=1 Tax=Protopolystoma xenopodis TaxID=117903 RepID=A0A3S5BLM5_9PLAT|nr:unnamed protein product [Protopolystoma xenopodis]
MATVAFGSELCEFMSSFAIISRSIFSHSQSICRDLPPFRSTNLPDSCSPTIAAILGSIPAVYPFTYFLLGKKSPKLLLLPRVDRTRDNRESSPTSQIVSKVHGKM